MSESDQASDRPQPSEIRRGKHTYRLRPDGFYHCKETDEVMDTILVAVILRDDDALYGHTVQDERHVFTPGGGKFGGAGASEDLSSDASDGDRSGNDYSD